MFKPLGDNVIIEKVPEEEKNKFGIIIPSNVENTERNDIGKVIAVSEKVNSVKESDEVVYCKYAGSSLKYCGKDCLILDISDILAVKEE